jgi:toxin ParE1/3/4
VIRLRFSSAAEKDLIEAQAWYADQAPDLDLAFRDELDHTLLQMRTYPAGFPMVHESIRRANLRRFPYSVFYVERRDHLFLLGIVHQSRSPSFWKRRW